jgi:protein tyrosine/serine phosphatase
VFMAALLDRLYNLHWVTPDVARSAQPYLGFYPSFLRAHGFRSIINLRGPNPAHRWWRREKAMAESLGVAHFDVRMSSRLLPCRESLNALFDAFEQAPRPVLIKCSGGQDRTGLAAALYVLNIGGRGALKMAESQLSFWPYLHRAKPRQRWLRALPAYVAEHSEGVRLDQWVRAGYAPERFAEWLQKRGQSDSYLTIQSRTLD